MNLIVGCDWIIDLARRNERRVQADSEKVKLRKTLDEHPLGTIKHYWNHRKFLMKGLENVGAETSLSVLAYRYAAARPAARPASAAKPKAVRPGSVARRDPGRCIRRPRSPFGVENPAFYAGIFDF